MSEQAHKSPATEQLTDDQLDEVGGGIIIHGRAAQLPAVQVNASSILLGGPDTTPIGGQF